MVHEAFLLSTYYLIWFSAIMVVIMNIDKFFIIPLLVLGVFVIYGPVYNDENIKASIWANEEKEFFKPIDVVWRGEIISTMAGGSCIGMKGGFDNYSKAMACFSDEHPKELWKFEGVVTVTGKWLGITCAYKNTVFGECVPSVGIENIRQ